MILWIKFKNEKVTLGEVNKLSTEIPDLLTIFGSLNCLTLTLWVWSPKKNLLQRQFFYNEFRYFTSPTEKIISPEITQMDFIYPFEIFRSVPKIHLT